MRHRTHRLEIEIEVRLAVSLYSVVGLNRLTYVMNGKSEMFNICSVTNFPHNRRDLQMISFSGNSSLNSLNIPEPLNP